MVTANHRRVLDWSQPDAGVLSGTYSVEAEAACASSADAGTGRPDRVESAAVRPDGLVH